MGGECVGPCVGDVAPTYDTPVGRPHVADGFLDPPCTP